MSILNVENLKVTFKGAKSDKEIVKNISFQVEEGKCLCVLGESGSGKSMSIKAVIGLLDDNFTCEGKALFEGKNLLEAGAEELRKLRGRDITMILQNPMTCFDSLYPIGYQMSETFAAHTDWTQEEIHKKSVEILDKMLIKQPEEVMRKYPHQVSGGMLQRIMIGIALGLNPRILVADEPTTAIDAITQFEIVKEFQRLKENNTTMIFITHDLGIASVLADEVIVMNEGKVVDRGSFKEVTTSPKDEYTRLLVEKRQKVMTAYKKILEGEAQCS